METKLGTTLCHLVLYFIDHFYAMPFQLFFIIMPS